MVCLQSFPAGIMKVGWATLLLPLNSHSKNVRGTISHRSKMKINTKSQQQMNQSTNKLHEKDLIHSSSIFHFFYL